MRALASLLLFFVVACGENIPPTVGDIRPSNSTVRRFQEFFITLIGVEDPDGNVYAGKVRVTAHHSDETLEGEIVPFESEPSRSKGDVIFGATLSGDVPLGAWNFEVIFEDEAGAEADPAITSITLTR